jgi:outer membrane protein assembly factor BamB
MRLPLTVLALALALGACSQQRAQFQDGLYAVSGAGADIAKFDTVPELRKRAGDIRQMDAPPPALWESILPGETADLIQLIDERRLLVGVQEFDRDQGAPAHGPLQLHDVATGSILWQAKRPSYPTGSYSLLSTSPVIVLLGGDANGSQMLALETSSGAQRWAHTLKGEFRAAMSPAEDHLILASPEGSQHRVQSIALGSGAVVWTTSLDSRWLDPRKLPQLQVAEDAVYVIGRRLVKLALRSGQVQWTLEHPLLDASDAEATPTPAGIVLWNSIGVALADSAAGRVRWTANPGDDGIKLVALEGRLLFRVVSKRGAAADAIHALDAATGQTLWTHDAAGVAVSPLVFGVDEIYYATDEAVVAVETRTGRERFRSELPGEFLLHPTKSRYAPSQENGALPDQLRVRGRTLLVARDGRGIAAYELSGGKRLWSQGVPPAAPNASAIQQTIDMMTGQAAGAAAQAPRLPAPAPLVGSNIALKSAQSNYDSARSRYLSVQSSPTASASERSSARGAYLSASSQLEIQERMAATAAQTSANVAAISGAGTAAIGALAAAKNARDARAAQLALLRLRMELASAQQMWQRALQDNVFIQPIGRFIEGGVMVVDLDSGERSDIVYAARPFLGFAADLQNALVDWESRRLFATGIGLNPDRYQDEVKWRMRTVRPSLLAYDLSKVRFERTTRRQGELTKTMAAAAAPRPFSMLITFNDTDGIRRAIKTGTNINAPEPGTGVVLLNFATALSNRAMVRFLLDSGADPTVRDGNGKTAIDLAKTQPDREVRDMVLRVGK